MDLVSYQEKKIMKVGGDHVGGFEKVGEENGGMNKILFYYTQYKVLKNKEKY